MRLLIATWGEPDGWNKVRYEFEGVQEESCSTLGLLNKVINPDRTIVITTDTLAAKRKEIKKCETKRREAEVIDTLKLSELSYDTALELVKDYIKRTAKVFNAKVDDVWVVPSVGYFSNAVVEGHFPDFRYSLFLHFFKIFEELISDGEKLEVFLDITHGQNFLPTFTSEVLNIVLGIAAYFVKDVRITILNSDPFIPASRPEILKIHKVFDNRLIIPQPYRFYAKRLGFLGGFEKKAQDLQKILEPIRSFINDEIPKEIRLIDQHKAFLGAIMNALPLVIFYSYAHPKYIEQLLSLVEEIYKQNIKLDIKNVLINNSESEKLFIYRFLKFLPEVEVFSVYGMYLKGLKLKYSKLVNTLDPQKVKKDGVPFEFLKIIKSLWSHNERDDAILTKEIGDIKSKGDVETLIDDYLENKQMSLKDWLEFMEKFTKTGDIFLFDWKLLSELEGKSTNSDTTKDNNTNKKSEYKKSYDPIRNFLAHAGLTKNIIELKFEGSLFIRYKLDNDEVNIWKAAAKGLKPLEEKKK